MIIQTSLLIVMEIRVAAIIVVSLPANFNICQDLL